MRIQLMMCIIPGASTPGNHPRRITPCLSQPLLTPRYSYCNIATDKRNSISFILVLAYMSTACL